MLDYAIVNISGRQYKVVPGQTVQVDHLAAKEAFESDQVLLIAEGGKIKLGQPFLKDKLQFEVVEQRQGDKIRVATYKAKANTRKTTGSRARLTVIKLKE